MGYRRSAIALVLVLVAVALPTGAWYVAGHHQIENRRSLAQGNIALKAQRMGGVEAERLGARLERLRLDESQRPFYHYKNLFHDPRAAAEGAFVTPSPLAHGSPDPLISAHFQVDSDGILTLPTINDEMPELGLQSTNSAHCAILEELSEVTYFCLEEMVFGDRAEPLGIAEKYPDEAQVRRTVLSAWSWRQHLDANALYADLKYAGGSAADERRNEKNGAEVQIAVWPFEWYTLPVGDEPGLVALRKVETPEGVWSQGFVVANDAVSGQLASSYYPATFSPMLELRSTPRADWMIYEVPGTDWGVGVDVSQATAEVLTEATEARRRFVGTFAIGALAAVLAGLLVVAMVYQAERLAAQRAQFAASAAHELRTPIAGLRLYGEMLAEGLGNPESTRSYARRMASEAERLGRVVTNVLSFTRLERKSIAVRPELGDLRPTVEAAFLRQKPALEEAGAAFKVNLPKDLPKVHFDQDAVGQIVQNLLDNAEKYTRDVPNRLIELTLGAGGPGVELRVADNGAGVPAKDQAHLFQPFSRGQQEDAEGLGLGLVLVKALATAQGGGIRYQDRPGGGAEFTVTFST